MNVAMLRVPASLAGDPSDVTVALEVAGALWEKGDNDEAIRWLKRAVDAAVEAGDAPRAASLAQAAADLEAAALESRQATASQPAVPVAAAPPPPSSAPSVASVPPAPPASARANAAVPPSQVPSRGAGASRPPPLPSSAAVMTQSVAWGRGGRIRVSVKTSVRDPTLLLLRPLPEGQLAPTGTREGFLVLTETEVEGRSNSNGGAAK
jgi:hypothetical protein